MVSIIVNQTSCGFMMIRSTIPVDEKQQQRREGGRWWAFGFCGWIKAFHAWIAEFVTGSSSRDCRFFFTGFTISNKILFFLVPRGSA